MKIYREKVAARLSSGPSSSALDACNVLLVTSTDRLARNTGDLLNILYAVKKVGAGFHSVIEPMVDTTRSLPKLSLPCRGSWLASSAIVSPSAAGSRPRPGRQARSSRGPYPSSEGRGATAARRWRYAAHRCRPGRVNQATISRMYRNMTN